MYSGASYRQLEPALVVVENEVVRSAVVIVVSEDVVVGSRLVVVAMKVVIVLDDVVGSAQCGG